MPYTQFNPLTPDPVTQGIIDVCTSSRSNQTALRDMVLLGMAPGWGMAAAGGTEDQPATISYTKGVEVVRSTITWGSSGGADGAPTAIVWDYSADSGSTWLTMGTINYTYSAGGACISSTWS